MRTAKIILGAALLLAGVSRAAEAPLDADFSVIQALAAPRAPSGGRLTDAQAESERRQQVALFVFASDKARTFHVVNPSHPKAAEARKLEVSSLLRAVRDGAPEIEGKALALARNFRSDRSNSVRDRYEVAAMARLLDVHRQNHGESTADALAAYEKAAMDLYGEFPEEPAVFELFLGVARTAEAGRARSIANTLLQMPAPASIKEEARTLLARLDLPGQPLDAYWTDEQGAPHHVRDYKGKVVVFYVWATWAPSPSADDKVKTLPANTVVISVNIDGDSAKAKIARDKMGVSGVDHYDNRGLNAPLLKQLRATKVPGTYVVNAQGVFIGGGSPEMLATLLASATTP